MTYPSHIKKSPSTCKCSCMSESSDLWIGQTGKERDNIVHEILVVNYGVLALLHEDLHKVAEVVAEFLPGLPVMMSGYSPLSW